MPMVPMFYVLAPEYLRLLLYPVIYYSNSGAWPHNYTIHNIGAHYPNETGHNDGEAQKMPIEESGNLLALMYMYELASSDTDYKNQFLDMLKTYAYYLVENGLHPVRQYSTDDGAGGPVVATTTTPDPKSSSRPSDQPKRYVTRPIDGASSTVLMPWLWVDSIIWSDFGSIGWCA